MIMPADNAMTEATSKRLRIDRLFSIQRNMNAP